LTGEELARFGRDLARISAYVEQLAEVAARPVERDAVLPLVADAEAWREDRAHVSFSIEQALSGAPDPSEGFFRVPKVLG
jgi:aspartyl/glutamyl-tRNA(Asn/Gln) amidotransferase C subunit